MDYLKLILGFAFLVIFTWILIRNSKRSGLIHVFFRIDTILGMAAGLYLVFTSVHSLVTH
jgi:hypothetical protein